jgi:hypothetical protein
LSAVASLLVWYKSKPLAFWTDKVHAYLDNKNFPIYLNGKNRSYAARRVARGAYRADGEGLHPGHIKPKKNLKHNTGAGSVNVACAISAEKTLMWHVLDGNWNAERAAQMYTQKLAPALARAYPGARQYLVLEDNDPSGYKSRRGIAAKEEKHITVFDFPKRSPDLNPLDYSYWATLNKKLRAQEKKFKPSFRESKVAYLARLRRGAMGMSSSELKKMIGSMRRRLGALAAANGRHFEE